MRRVLLHKLTLIIVTMVILCLCILAFVELLKIKSTITVSLPQKEISLAPMTQTEERILPIISPPLLQYIEILESCGPYYEGSCVNMRSGPGKEYPIVARLRTGIVLRVEEIVTRGGRNWYKIQVDKNILHPERVIGNWFVASGDYAKLFTDVGDQQLSNKEYTPTTKYIIVDTSEQMLYAYDGKVLFTQESVSTGLELTPTPNGRFTVYKKTPSRYMQGPSLDNNDNSDQYYDLPGVPWDLYFTYEGAVIHGTYWHDHFGEKWSHGCVNLSSEKAKKLYQWADIGIPVIIQD